MVWRKPVRWDKLIPKPEMLFRVFYHKNCERQKWRGIFGTTSQRSKVLYNVATWLFTIARHEYAWNIKNWRTWSHSASSKSMLQIVGLSFCCDAADSWNHIFSSLVLDQSRRTISRSARNYPTITTGHLPFWPGINPKGRWRDPAILSDSRLD